MAGLRSRWKCAVSAAALYVAAGEVTAQTLPAAPPLAQAEDENADDIIVTASDADQIRIDRRTYTVRDDPAAQATEAFDILGRIPSVSVAPSGDIRLLGGTGVAIQIDGQPVPSASTEQVLRSLTGGEIERIEVITNPPSSQSAASSAGIINIITRNRRLSGLSGTALVIVDTLGSSQYSVAPSWTQGPWTLSGRANYINNLGATSFVRDSENFTSGIVTRDEGPNEFDIEQNGANLQLAYRFNERRRASITFDRFAADNSFDQNLSRTVNGAPSNTLSTLGANTFLNERAYALFQQTGENQSLFKLTGSIGRFESTGDRRSDLVPTVGAPTELRLFDGQEGEASSIGLEVERPMGGARLLTFGGSLDHLDQEMGSGRQTLIGSPTGDYLSALSSEEQTSAAYAGYQFATGSWTWQPGLRVERYERELNAAGGASDTDETILFPSIHIRRRFSPSFDLDLSYSSRIQRPDLFQLDPTIRPSPEGSRANSGNPNLEPTTTDAYEANLTYQNGGSMFSVTFFDRISDDIVSPFTELQPGGVLLRTFVNAGTSEQRGLQTILRGPIGENWRYSLSANFLNREFDVLSGGTISRRTQFEYGGNAQIEWRDANQSEPGADHFQFDVQFQGPRATLQGETDEFVLTNFTWRRRLTNRLSSTLLWADVFDTNTTESFFRTEDVFDQVEGRGVEPRVRFSLTYQFGSLTNRPQQPQDQPPPLSGPQ